MSFVRENCYWCDKDVRGLDAHGCDCLETHKVTAVELEVGMAIFNAEFCDHFCCGLPREICRMRQITKELSGKFEMKSINA